jgi:hypothetical protein
MLDKDSSKLEQALRPVYKNQTSAVINTDTNSSDKIIHLEIHHDSTTGKDVILWDDVLMVFKDALYIQNGTSVCSYVKGDDLNK